MQNKHFYLLILVLFSILVLLGLASFLFVPEKENPFNIPKPGLSFKEIPRFQSDEELVKAIEKAQADRSGNYGITESMPGAPGMLKATQESVSDSGGGIEYSATNIQVQGVDEADIVKTDGNYIYILAKNKLIIARAYPAEKAEILSQTSFENFYAQELFINQNRLLVFGQSNYSFPVELGKPINDIQPYHRQISAMSAKLYDITSRQAPKVLKTIDLEGSYLTSRKIEDNVYFAVNSYPHYEHKVCSDILPLYRFTEGEQKPVMQDFQPIARCMDIGYIEPIQANNFIIIASISMSDANKELTKEVILGSGENVYASLENLYIAQTSSPDYGILDKVVEESQEKTIVTKFYLNSGKIKYVGTGEIKGHLLNQFSMDENNGYFRVATTRGSIWDQVKPSSNNIYILDQNLNLVGSLEDLAPGEKIYSARFMGKKAYLVTFKKVDPLFVLDLSDPFAPQVLGKLKIPGYSDYLHPYDENHIIGIGKETVEAEEDLKEQRQLDFAWYQGVKMAIFDVSDVENPIEMHKTVIGDRGTDSDALNNHKAFLFDKKRNLLVLPITLAEIKGEKSTGNQYGDYTFQGAYVYKITLQDGFDLRGRITHYDTDEVFKKSGFYFSGDSAVKRSLFIENTLYTLSDQKLKLNDLASLEELKTLNFGD